VRLLEAAQNRRIVCAIMLNPVHHGYKLRKVVVIQETSISVVCYVKPSNVKIDDSSLSVRLPSWIRNQTRSLTSAGPLAEAAAMFEIGVGNKPLCTI
jgi:hypothetical protein